MSWTQTYDIEKCKYVEIPLQSLSADVGILLFNQFVKFLNVTIGCTASCVNFLLSASTCLMKMCRVFSVLFTQKHRTLPDNHIAFLSVSLALTNHCCHAEEACTKISLLFLLFCCCNYGF